MGKKKDPNAVSLGRRGGKARAERLSASALSSIGKKGARSRSQSLSASQRSEIARKAASARWERSKKGVTK